MASQDQRINKDDLSSEQKKLDALNKLIEINSRVSRRIFSNYFYKKSSSKQVSAQNSASTLKTFSKQTSALESSLSRLAVNAISKSSKIPHRILQ